MNQKPQNEWSASEIELFGRLKTAAEEYRIALIDLRATRAEKVNADAFEAGQDSSIEKIRQMMNLLK